jgi:hypothetical protein
VGDAECLHSSQLANDLKCGEVAVGHSSDQLHHPSFLQDVVMTSEARLQQKPNMPYSASGADLQRAVLQLYPAACSGFGCGAIAQAADDPL